MATSLAPKNEPVCGRLTDRVAAGFLWGVPTGVLVFSYVYLAHQHHQLNLLPVAVHESGRYTLAETIFYPRHFVREFPICAMMATALSSAFWQDAPILSRRDPCLGQWRALCITAYCGAAIVFGINACSCAYQLNLLELIIELCQFRRRDDWFQYGSHWQYHLLHLGFFLPAASGVATLLRLWNDRTTTIRHDGRSLLAWWLFVFVVLTTVFGPSLEPFRDPLYVAHQLREIATHGSITLISTAALLYTLDVRMFPTRGRMAAPRHMRNAAISCSIALAMPLFLLFQLRHANVFELAQSKRGLIDLFASHNFEHAMDYLFVGLLAVGSYLHLHLAHLNNHARRK